MSEIRIDKRKALSLLFGAVKARGRDYVYEANAERNYGCVYTLDGEPDCMVGQALADAGVRMPVLTSLNDKGTITCWHVKEALAAEGVILSDGAYKAFEMAQARQDAGRPWGEAYDVAKGA